MRRWQQFDTRATENRAAFVLSGPRNADAALESSAVGTLDAEPPDASRRERRAGFDAGTPAAHFHDRRRRRSPEGGPSCFRGADQTVLAIGRLQPRPMADAAVLNHRHRRHDAGFDDASVIGLEGQHHAFAGANQLGAGHQDVTVRTLMDDHILKSP